MRTSAGNERIYGYAFYLDLEGPSGASIICNSEEALRRLVPRKGRVGGDKSKDQVPAHRWGPEHWAYQVESSEELRAVLALLHSGQVRDTDAALTDASLAALRELDQEGFFGTGKERDSVVLLLFETDQSHESVLTYARQLNPSGALGAIERDLAPRSSEGSCTTIGSRGAYSIDDLVLSRDGSTLAAFGAFGGGEIFVWRVADWTETFALHTDSDGFWTGVLAPDGQWMALGTKGGVIRRWHLSLRGEPAMGSGLTRNGRGEGCSPVREGDPMKGHRDAITALALSPDGKRLVSASWDKSVRLWDISTGKALQVAKVLARRLHFAPSGDYVAATNGSVRLLDGASLKEGGALGRNDDRFTCSALSADGRRLAASCGAAGAPIFLFDVGSRKRTAQIPGPVGGLTALAFSPSGRLLATGDSRGGAMVIDPESGRQVATFRAKMEAVAQVVFLPDERTLAVAGSDVNQGPPVYLWGFVLAPA